MAYKIKQIPEDFAVREISKIPESEETKRYSYFVMEKREYSTSKACSAIAKFLRVPLKDIGYAGNKDKQAVTKQLISVKNSKNISPKTVQAFKNQNIKLSFAGKGHQPICLGDLEGNHFEITIRNLDENDSIKPKNTKYFINYFGEQRFGKKNAEIGKLLVKKKFKGALQIISEPELREYQKEHQNTGDAVAAVKKVPRRVLMLYVHAYQSLLFNRIAGEFIKITGEKNIENFKDTMIPVVGFGSEYKDGEIKKITEKILKEEGINERDFIIREIPDISSEGRERNLTAEIKNLIIGELEEDELNIGKKKCKIIFDLDKSCYATEAIKQIIK